MADLRCCSLTLILLMGPLPGVLGNRGKMSFISGEQRPNFEGNKDNIGEQGTQENKFSIFGNMGTNQFISGEQVPPPPPPPL